MHHAKHVPYYLMWEPSYFLYPHLTDLPRVVQALTDLIELPESKKAILSKENRKLVRAVTLALIHEIRVEREDKRSQRKNLSAHPAVSTSSTTKDTP